MTIAADPSGYGTGDLGAVTDESERTTVRRLSGITTAAACSIGAGAIHAAATGIHAEHPALARLFVLVAVLQLGAGLLALVRPDRIAASAIVVVNAGAVAGWLATRITSISSIEGLETREAPQFADTSCALLGAVAVGAALAGVLAGWHQMRPTRLLVPGLAVAALTIPAMISGGTHVHSHDEGAASTHPHDESTTAGGDGSGTGIPPTDTHSHDESITGDTTATSDTVHSHDTTPAVEAAPWPRPWDPAEPLDLSGVVGVSAEQEARATALVEASLRELPKYADPAAAVADGYASIGDAGTGSEHYIKVSLIQDDVILDATQPESLVYAVNGDERTLAGAMYIASARPTDDPELVEWAGPLMQWHNHGNLCWALDEAGVAKVVGIVGADGTCARGINTGGENPMVHVWITPHPCGVFAALEGVGAGQAAVPEDQRVDMCGAGHDHGSAAPAPTGGATYDPTKPIDLGGVPGVTPEQQAAAENLVAVTLVRLPQWSDYKVAEAAGFHSIGDGLTGHEHFVQWDWINDDVILDPDHPESLVYQPQPDGSKKLVSAMYMLPNTVGLDEVPDIGGALTQWHIHDNLCYTPGDAPRVAGLTDANGDCRPGLVEHDPAPMIHVWIVSQPCGPFASLEGVGAGQIAEGEERLCDHVHGTGG